jgi:tRNA threonylcarbamoyl adenosine modification protein YeaZ
VLVLGLDTSTPAVAVALCEVGSAGHIAELARREVVDARRSGELLAPLIDEALKEVGRPRCSLDAVVVGVGPGPYTSLRVGIVTAAALADALGIAAHGICSLDGVPRSGPEPVTVATDARRREVYWARYAGNRRIAGPDVAAPAELAASLGPGERVIGAGGRLYAEVFGGAFDPAGAQYPDPAQVIREATSSLGQPAGPLVPLYLRRPDASPAVATRARPW